MINLSKGQATEISKDATEASVTLSWKTAIDFDLHCKIESVHGEKEHIYFGDKRGRYGELDQDAGIGDSAGSNKEKMKLKNLKEIKRAIFYVNIFNHSNEDFSKYQGKLLINFAGKPILVEMKHAKRGANFIICSIEEGAMININEVTSSQPGYSYKPVIKELVTLSKETGEVVVSGIKGVLGKFGSFLSKLSK